MIENVALLRTNRTWLVTSSSYWVTNAATKLCQDYKQVRNGHSKEEVSQSKGQMDFPWRMQTHNQATGIWFQETNIETGFKPWPWRSCHCSSTTPPGFEFFVSSFWLLFKDPDLSRSLVAHHGGELFVADAAVAVHVGLSDHLVDLLPGQVLAEARHHLKSRSKGFNSWSEAFTSASATSTASLRQVKMMFSGQRHIYRNKLLKNVAPKS